MILLLLLSLPINDFKVIQGLYADGMYELSEKQARVFIQKYPDEKITPDVCVILLNSMLKQRKYGDVINSADRFIKRYPQKRSDFYRIKGDAQVKLGLFKEAIRTYSRLKGDDAYTKIGDAYYAMGDYKKAMEYFGKVKDDYAILSTGWCYYKLGDYENAYKTFSQVKDKKYTEEAEYMKGKCLLKIGRKDAEDTLLNFIKKYPETPYRGRIYLSLGEYFESKGNIDRAKNYYKKLLRLRPPFNHIGLTYLGILYYNEGKLDSAYAYLEKVPVTSQYFGNALYYMGLVKIKKGEKLDGITVLQQVMEDYPGLRDYAAFRIGEVFEGMGKTEDAIRYYLDVKGKERVKALLRAGDILMKTNPDSGLSIYRKALETGKDRDLALLKIGVALFKMKKYRDCVNHLNADIKKFRSPVYKARAYLLLGDASLKLKDYKNAVKYYNIAVNTKIKEVVPYGLEGLGWAYTGLKDYAKAFKVLDRLQKEYPEFRGKGSLYLTLGDVAFAMGDYKRAEKSYKRVKGRQEPEAMFRLGKLYMNTGKYRKAAEVFLNLRKKYSVFEKSDLALYLASLSLRKAGDIYSSIAQVKSLIKSPIDKELKRKGTLLLADNYFDIAEYDSAIHYYEKNLDLYTKPDNGMLPAIKGILYSLKKKGRNLEDKGNDYIRRFKGTGIDDRVKFILGEILLNEGDYKRAEKYLKDSTAPEAQLLLADVYLKTGRDNEGLKILKTLQNTPSVSKEASLKLLSYYMGRKMYKEALPIAEKMGDEGVEYRVKALIGLKRFRDALKLAEGLKGCKGALYRGLSLLGLDDESGVAHIDSSTTCDETAPEAIYEKSLYLYKKGKVKGIETELVKVRYLYPESEYYSPSMILLAKVFLKQGKKQEAVKVLEDVIKRKDKYEKEARSLLNNIH